MTNNTPTLTITLTEHEPNALFLRREVASGEAPDGTRISVEQAGERILLRHTSPDEAVTLHSFLLSEVIQTWAAKIDAPPTSPAEVSTPEEIAATIVNDNTAPNEWSPVLMSTVAGLAAAAIRADRAQRTTDGEGL